MKDVALQGLSGENSVLLKEAFGMNTVEDLAI